MAFSQKKYGCIKWCEQVRLGRDQKSNRPAISQPGWNCRRPWHCVWTYGTDHDLHPCKATIQIWVSRGWKGSREKKREGVWETWRTCAGSPEPAVEDMENLVRWFGIGRRRRIVVRSVPTAAVGLPVTREDNGGWERWTGGGNHPMRILRQGPRRQAHRQSPQASRRSDGTAPIF